LALERMTYPEGREILKKGLELLKNLLWKLPNLDIAVY
jgi:hypothetical protein